MNNNDILAPGSASIRPIVNVNEAIHLAQRLYGLGTLRLKELLSYDDRNFLIQEEETSNQYTLKILNSLDSKISEYIEAQNELLLFLFSKGIVCPTPILNVNRKYYSNEMLPGNSDRCVVRLMNYIPGEMLYSIPVSDALYYNVGEFIAQIDLCIQGNFDHPGYKLKKSVWMLNNISEVGRFVSAVDNENNRELALQVIKTFEQRVLSQMDYLEKGIIHGDANEHNILASLEISDDDDDDVNGFKKNNSSWKISGIIDFGDSQYSCYLFELGIAATYAALHAARQRNGNAGQALKALGHLIAGFLHHFPLKENELQLLQVCVCARLVQSLVLGAHTAKQDPNNSYVLSSSEIGWHVLLHLWRLPECAFQHSWRDLLPISTPL